MSEKKRIVGIDLGTTNTCVAYVRNRIPKVVPTDRGNLILPSVVALSPKGDLVVGGVAKDQMVINPRNTIYGAKRLIGRKFDSQGRAAAARATTRTTSSSDANGDAAVTLGDKIYSLPQISSFVLGHVKTIAEQFLGGPIEEAVISVPAYYNDNQRNAVKEAGQAGRLQREAHRERAHRGRAGLRLQPRPDQKVLVYDLGGGTFDVVVLQLTGNVFEVLATGGDTFLGGVDFDNRIIDYVLDAFAKEELKVDLAREPHRACSASRTRPRRRRSTSRSSPTCSSSCRASRSGKGKPLDLRVPLTAREAQSADRRPRRAHLRRSATRC